MSRGFELNLIFRVIEYLYGVHAEAAAHLMRRKLAALGATFRDAEKSGERAKQFVGVTGHALGSVLQRQLVTMGIARARQEGRLEELFNLAWSHVPPQQGDLDDLASQLDEMVRRAPRAPRRKRTRVECELDRLREHPDMATAPRGARREPIRF